MIWLPKENCYAFCENSVAAYAPPASGVYGLYNFDYQLYIGESANIRAALLQHLGEIECQPVRYQPTGFAFEVCAGELRAAKAERLRAAHHPVRQTEWPRADSWVAEASGAEESTYVFNSPTEKSLDGADHTVPASETPPMVRKRFYFAGGQVLVLTVMFALSLAVIFFLGIFTGESIQKKARAGYETNLAKNSDTAPSDQSGTMTSNVDGRNPLDEAVKSLSKFPVQPDSDTALLEPDRPTGSTAPRKYAVSVPVTAAADDSYLSLVTAAEVPAPSRSAQVLGRDGSWAVQLAANRERKNTEEEVAKLKAKGYDGYLVETERAGQIWYRVRVGRFATRAEAEALRGILSSREGYRSPIITQD